MSACQLFSPFICRSWEVSLKSELVACQKLIMVQYGTLHKCDRKIYKTYEKHAEDGLFCQIGERTELLFVGLRLCELFIVGKT